MTTFTTTSTLAALLINLSAHAAIVINANCEQAYSVGWQIRDSIPSAVPPTTLSASLIATDHRPGSLGLACFQISGRDHVQDGPKQNIASALTASGNGKTYTTRLWVKIASGGADASVRCLLRWIDGTTPQKPLILAEAVVTNSGSWVEVVGTTKLQWTTAIASATLEFEVEQLHKANTAPFAVTWFPPFLLDDITLDVDSDGDGLLDSEESADHAQTTLSFLDSADSDADRMSDDWERNNQLNPRDGADALSDLDGDGFTNAQEFFAATSPRDGESYPGKPSDAQATTAARALLRYLALCPYNEHTLVGQMVSDNTTEYDDYVVALAAQPGGKWVSILGLAVEALYAPLDIHASIDHAIAFTNAGGIAQVKWAAWNPWRAHLFVPPPPWAGFDPIIGRTGDMNMVDIPGLLDPLGTPTNPTNTAADNLAARVVFNGWIDTIALEFQRFNAATNNKPILFRPLSEMNGQWFWWGHRTRAEYIGLWNHIRNRLMTTHGLHNIIWVYESASSEHTHPTPTGTSSASDYYYPGDDAVDIFGHNLYDGDWILPFDANKIYARHPKIYAVPQAGPDRAWPNRTGAFDNRIYRDQIVARYMRNSFFIVWNSQTSHLDDDNNPATPPDNDDPDPTTTDDPFQHIAIINNQNSNALLADARIITRDELNWMPSTGDLNFDGQVDGADLSLLLAEWGSDNPIVADVNNDGIVDGSDLTALLSNFG